MLSFTFLVTTDYLKRKNIYSENSKLDFIVFSYGVLEFLKYTGFIPDIIHLNNWNTSIIPALMSSQKTVFSNTKTLLTIHNILYQGIFNKQSILSKLLNLTKPFKHKNQINILKGGIVLSNAVNTVSQNYLKEICTRKYGAGLDRVLRKHCDKLYGILNGIDYTVWNPENDIDVYENFSYRNIQKKLNNKEAFLKEVGLYDKNVPLIVFVGKLKKEHSIDLLVESFEDLVNLPANFAFLVYGEENYVNIFNTFKGKYKNIFIKTAFDEAFSRKMYAAGDFFLKPSLHEPCGISQMIAMKYGNIVIARKTGGIVDTVKDIKEKDGYGILFDRFSKKELIFSIKRAISLYQQKDHMQSLRRYVSTLDFSWDRSVAKYIRLYESLKFG